LFYYIELKIKKGDKNVIFIWSRKRLFDKEFVQTIMEKIEEVEEIKVSSVNLL
jgi:hypothetical protein